MATLTCASLVEAPRCGVEMKPGVPNSGESLAGSCLEHVERRTGDMAAVEPVLERRFVDQPAARAIDDPHSRFRLREILPRQDSAGLVGQRRVKGDEIGASEQLFELNLFHAHLDRALGG
jgi:hypothetical protein